VKLLGKGGENMIFRVNSFLPVEIIAKVPLNQDSFSDLILEDQFIKLVYDPEFICKIIEEIILFNK
jgi:hypothetical protein